MHRFPKTSYTAEMSPDFGMYQRQVSEKKLSQASIQTQELEEDRTEMQ